MNKLALASIFLAPIAIALTAPGCSDNCKELAEVCARCLDADYRAACDEIVAQDTQATCGSQLGTYEAFCPALDLEGIGGSTGTTGGPCATGEAQCNGVCIDVQGDPANCGSCGTTCSADAGGEFCIGGSCSGECATPREDCGNGVCANVATDPEFCGTSCADATACSDTQVCSEGGCAAECGDGLTDCSRACVDLANDLENCGGCGVACAAGQVCANGVCASDCGGLTTCCGECVDTSSDPAHCGGCDASCPEYVAPTCNSCIECGDALPPTAGDIGNLCDGANGASQAAWDTLVACGATQCPAECNGDPQSQACFTCLETSCATELASCQADACVTPPPPQACAAGEVCDGTGTCGPSCTSGTVECNGACVASAVVNGNPVPSTAAHCGACGNVCTDGATCVDGACNPQGTCADGKIACNGTCVDTSMDPFNCGGCGNVCTGTSPVCQAGSCAGSCSAPLSNCGNSCVDTSSDPNHCGGCAGAGGTVCTGTSTPSCQAGACVGQCDTNSFLDCGNGSCIPANGNDPNNCGSCGNSCNDNDICTVDFCSNGECNNTGGTQACDDGNPCTKDECDAVLGCVNPLYTQQEVEGICSQLMGLDASTQCVFCSPGGDFCNTSPPTPGPTPSGSGLPCTDLDSGQTCGTCTIAATPGAPPTCDVTSAPGVPCPVND